MCPPLSLNDDTILLASPYLARPLMGTCVPAWDYFRSYGKVVGYYKTTSCMYEYYGSCSQASLVSRAYKERLFLPDKKKDRHQLIDETRESWDTKSTHIFLF